MLDAGIPMPAASASMPMSSCGSKTVGSMAHGPYQVRLVE
jgi:hypothetical protein